MKYCLFIFLLPLLWLQCRYKTKDTEAYSKDPKSSVKYAKGFDIITKNKQKVLLLKGVIQHSDKPVSYTLSKAAKARSANQIKIPVKSIVVTSTTHIPMLELLEVEHTLVGFPHTKYISSVKTRKRIKEGKLVDLGLEESINAERLIELNPELLIASSLHANNKLYHNLKKEGIKVIFNGDWLEQTPLGRSEWIKFFGILFNKEKMADSIFKSIETEYLKVKNAAQNQAYSATVLTGSMYSDVWNVAAGKSFIANFLKDANLNYLWKSTKGTGSLQLSFESVLEKAKHADYWLYCGMYETKKQLISANIHYREFSAFAKNNIYTIASKKGESGGLLYFELSPVKPNLVLKDLIKITRPEAFPNYKLTFFSKLK
ncbi:MAG: ABC transporter substrate-binding protein [Tenacibaculum sp.]